MISDLYPALTFCDTIDPRTAGIAPQTRGLEFEIVERGFSNRSRQLEDRPAEIVGESMGKAVHHFTGAI
jgi:hypothetical protein